MKIITENQYWTHGDGKVEVRPTTGPFFDSIESFNRYHKNRNHKLDKWGNFISEMPGSGSIRHCPAEIEILTCEKRWKNKKIVIS